MRLGFACWLMQVGWAIAGVVVGSIHLFVVASVFAIAAGLLLLGERE